MQSPRWQQLGWKVIVGRDAYGIHVILRLLHPLHVPVENENSVARTFPALSRTCTEYVLGRVAVLVRTKFHCNRSFQVRLAGLARNWGILMSCCNVNVIGPAPSKPFHASKSPSCGIVGSIPNPDPAPACETSHGMNGVPTILGIQPSKVPVSKPPLTTSSVADSDEQVNKARA